MIPYDIDPSLHTAAPQQGSLDDGFSPRSQELVPEPAPAARTADSLEDALAGKSDF